VNQEKQLRELGKGFKDLAEVLQRNAEDFANKKLTKEQWNKMLEELEEARKQRRKDEDLIKMSPETFYLKTFTI
jgi:hypothetical protein